MDAEYTEGDYLEFVGHEDPAGDLFFGHPGIVMDADLLPNELTVQFVNGPTECVHVANVQPLSMGEYVARGDRLVALLHPLVDRSVRQFWRPGQEWGGPGRPSV